MAEYGGFKTILQAYISGAYTAVAQVRDIDGPGITSDQIEVTHRDTVWRKYVAGMRDGGEVTFDIVFDPDHASHDPTVSTSMYKAAENGTVMAFRVIFPGVSTATTKCEFNAFVSEFTTGSPLEDGLTASLTLKITGSLTWAHVP